jgi:hypothetical protein
LADVRERLLVEAIDSPPAESFADVLELDQRATELGYPVLI